MRAFIAIDIPEEIKAAMSVWLQERPGIRKAAPENIHLTISFLGSITEKQAKEVARIIDSLQQRCFSISFQGTGSFVNGDHGVIYADIAEGRDTLKSLSSIIEEGLKKIHIHTEWREFTPHVTVARAKAVEGERLRVERLPKADKTKSFGSFLCTEVKLKKSTLTERGPIHDDIFIKRLQCE